MKLQTKRLLYFLKMIVNKVDFTFNEKGNYCYCPYIGIAINDDELTIGIENFQSCCENYGCVYYVNDVETKSENIDLIGKYVINVKVIEKVVEYTDENPFRAGCINEEKELNFEITFSDNTILRLEIYNNHNGYYSHEVICKSSFYSDSFSI